MNSASFTITDITISLLLAYCLYSGWIKGIVRILIGPLTLVISLAIAIFYFKQTHNFSYTFLILILGPLFLSIIWAIHLFLLRKKIDAEPSVSLLSRLLGMVFNLAWGIVLIAPTLMTIMLIPLPFAGLKAVQKDIGNSYAYGGCQKLLKKHTTPLYDVEKVVTVFKDPARVEQLQTLPEYQKISENPLVIKVIEDKEIMKQIQSGDIIKVMKNPNIQALINDQELMEQFIKLSQKLLKEEPLPKK